jgi:hypothetical protein
LIRLHVVGSIGVGPCSTSTGNEQPHPSTQPVEKVYPIVNVPGPVALTVAVLKSLLVIWAFPETDQKAPGEASLGSTQADCLVPDQTRVSGRG